MTASTVPARPSPPWVLVQDGQELLRFARPRDVVEARAPSGVAGALARMDEALRGGHWIAGFLAFESAAAFGLATHPPDPAGGPLLWLGVFDEPERVDSEVLRAGDEPVPGADAWRPALDAPAYARALHGLHRHIGAGDTYQVNFTFPLVAPFQGDPLVLFSRLVSAQRPRHAAFVDLGEVAVASASPELFFRLDGEELTARPMKGTAERGPTLATDGRQVQALRRSEKDRAENLMIVDMLRNDLGRVAEIGSVTVPALFDVERYPTLLQMTSTVRARSRASLAQILAALFPCASVTGAPKKRTMEIITQTETGPRGVYTGTVGWASPDGQASFNVAIRTAVVDRRRGVVSCGVGSGIVADSVACQEYAECLLKARILDERPFALLETLALAPGEGYRRLEGHLGRLRASARYFVIPLDEDRIEAALRDVADMAVSPTRVRLLVHTDGRVAVESAPLPSSVGAPARVGLAVEPVDPLSVWLHHKTTRREPYDAARASRPDCDDVLLWNTRGELTESVVANVFVERKGHRLTPPVSSGLLAGVERATLLAGGRAREAVVPVSDLRRGESIVLANSVRGEYEAEFVG